MLREHVSDHCESLLILTNNEAANRTAEVIFTCDAEKALPSSGDSLLNLCRNLFLLTPALTPSDGSIRWCASAPLRAGPSAPNLKPSWPSRCQAGVAADRPPAVEGV